MTGVASQSEKQNSNKGAMQIERAGVTGAYCSRCGCWRGELGQEPTVDRYVANLVSVFDAVRRVLRRDGLCWVNLSGSYFNNPGGQNGGVNNGLDYGAGRISRKVLEANRQAGRQDRIGAAGKGSWLKPLDWVDTPGLFAHAMQRAGWYWRADIALVKKSPLPESVQGTRWERCRVKLAKNKHCDPQGRGGQQRMMENPEDNRGVNPDWLAQWADCPGCSRCAPNDGLILRRGNGRPTRAWERFLVFAKAPGAYWDSDAVREPHAGYEYQGRNGVSVDGYVAAEKDGLARRSFAMKNREYHPAGRNLKDWQFWPTTGGVGGLQHYAAFPLGLPDLAIRAGTSERGVCGTCAAPWARVVERKFVPSQETNNRDGRWGGGDDPLAKTSTNGFTARGSTESETVAWRQTCSCNAGAPVPAVVLDPFVGSGTTLIAADRLGRSAIGIDVQPMYIDLAAGRARRDAPLLATVEVERQAEAGSKQRDLFSVLSEQEGVADAAD